MKECDHKLRRSGDICTWFFRVEDDYFDISWCRRCGAIKYGLRSWNCEWKLPNRNPMKKKFKQIVADGIASLANSIDSLHRQVAALSAPRSEQAYMVLWCTIPAVPAVEGLPFAHQSVFSVPIVDGVGEFMPQQLLRIDRWLYLGPGHVKGFTIGANYQTPTASVVGANYQTPTASVVDGMAGRYGEGKFPPCDVGNRVRFTIER